MSYELICLCSVLVHNDVSSDTRRGLRKRAIVTRYVVGFILLRSHLRGSSRRSLRLSCRRVYASTAVSTVPSPSSRYNCGVLRFYKRRKPLLESHKCERGN